MNKFKKSKSFITRIGKKYNQSILYKKFYFERIINWIWD